MDQGILMDEGMMMIKMRIGSRKSGRRRRDAFPGSLSLLLIDFVFGIRSVWYPQCLVSAVFGILSG